MNSLWKIVLATNNAHKVNELQNIFLQSRINDIELIGKNKVRQLVDHEVKENGVTFFENALLKCQQTYHACTRHASERFLGTIADDSGLVVPALGGEPGLHSARFSHEGTDEANREKLMSRLKKLQSDLPITNGGRESFTYKSNKLFSTPAHFVCCIVFYSERERNKKTVISAEGKLYGKVIPREIGEAGFGYDKLFIPQGYEQTLAEFSSTKKNSISHRGIASAILAKKMENFFTNLSVL